jgi:hypothetical protein
MEKKIKNKKEEKITAATLPTNLHLEAALPTHAKLKECEWCFQFGEDEPQIFAWTNNEDLDENPTVTFTITNSEDSYITFSKNGNIFKLFARPLTDAGKEMRDKSNEAEKQANSDIEEAGKQ